MHKVSSHTCTYTCIYTNTQSLTNCFSSMYVHVHMCMATPYKQSSVAIYIHLYAYTYTINGHKCTIIHNRCLFCIWTAWRTESEVRSRNTYIHTSLRLDWIHNKCACANKHADRQTQSWRLRVWTKHRGAQNRLSSCSQIHKDRCIHTYMVYALAKHSQPT